jgi:2-oxoglutarate ferredoxin oxidoreductase subunit delta
METFHCKSKEKTVAAENKELVINTAWCTGCGICAAFCPVKVLEIKREKVTAVNQSGCTKCGQCELRCPNYAIYVREVGK